MPGLEGRKVVRNALSLAGAYYLSSWVVAPLWYPITHFTANRVYHPGFESLAMEAVMLIPRIVGALLAGLAVGCVIETLNPVRWAIAFGIVVVIFGWISFEWNIPPDFSQRAGQALKTVIPGFAAVGGVYAGDRYVKKHGNTPAVGTGSR